MIFIWRLDLQGGYDRKQHAGILLASDLFGMVKKPGNQKITFFESPGTFFLFLFSDNKNTQNMVVDLFYLIVEPIGYPQPLPVRARLLSLERHNSYDLEPASRTETDWKPPFLGPFLGANC